MFDNPKKELEQLENRLLAAEADGQWLDEELADAHRLLGDIDYEQQPRQDLDATQVFRSAGAPVRNYANGYGRGVNYEEQYDYDDGEDFQQYNELSQKRGIRNLVILAVAESLAIVGIIAYWLVKIL